MTKTGINWSRKLSSRKFWAAFIGFLTPLLVLLRVDAETISQIMAVVASCSVLVSYILSEGFIDAKRAEKETEGELTHDE